MKKKIKITDNINGRVIEKEITERNLLHFAIQLKTRKHIQEDKTKYKRSRDKKVQAE